LELWKAVFFRTSSRLQPPAQFFQLFPKVLNPLLGGVKFLICFQNQPFVALNNRSTISSTSTSLPHPAHEELIIYSLTTAAAQR